jgi:RHS repeat-associated protein
LGSYLIRDPSGSGVPTLAQTRDANRVNEITEISNTTGPGWTVPQYDTAGNMIRLPQPLNPSSGYAATWDAWNRLVQLADGDTIVAQYAYDALTRRTVSVSPTESRDFYYSANWQILEERLGDSPDTALPDRQFVWGLQYIDQLLLRDRSVSGGSLNERLYALQDANWNVTALVDTSGTVQERYAYSAYGVPLFLNANFTPQSGNASAFAWETLYCGYRYESAVALYQVRYRTLHSLLGCWLSCDPAGTGPDVNLYTYVRNCPMVYIDSSGLKIAPCCKADASANRCIYIFTWEAHGYFPADTMARGHSSVSLSAYSDDVYGFHGKGIALDIGRGLTRGVMAFERIKSIYRCCCLTSAEYDTFKNEIATLARKAHLNQPLYEYNADTQGDPEDICGHEFNWRHGRGPLGQTVTDTNPYPVCAGTAQHEARLGCAHIAPSDGSDPLQLEKALNSNIYCEQLPTKNPSPPPSPLAPAIDWRQEIMKRGGAASPIPAQAPPIDWSQPNTWPGLTPPPPPSNQPNTSPGPLTHLPFKPFKQ